VTDLSGGTSVEGPSSTDLAVDVSSLGPGWVAQTSIVVGGTQVATCTMDDPLT
jgi:hypothetical protein